MTEAAAAVAEETTGSPPQLKRVLGGGFAFAAGVGTMIGLGVLRTPGEIVTVFSDPWSYLALWIVVGLFCLMSVSVAAELVGMTPHSGGYYALVRRGLGSYPGFLIGWIDWLAFAPTIALKTTVLVEFLGLLFPELQPWQKALAVAITTIFAFLQMRGVAFAARVQNVGAAGTGLVIVGMVVALLLADPIVVTQAAEKVLREPGLREYGLVVAAVIFAYDGWLGAAYFGGEIQGGGGVSARACVRGLSLIFFLYVGLNAALAFSVPLSQLAGQELALAHALELAWGEGAALVVICAAILILFSHQNSNYMSAPRVLYSLSRDGFAARRAANVHERGNPVVAVLITWAVAVTLILVGGIGFLLSLSTLFFVVLYIALMVGVFLLRRREPDADRPFRAWGHPYSTILCIIGWTSVTVFLGISAPETALSAIIMTAVSIPAYVLLSRRRKSQAALADSSGKVQDSRRDSRPDENG